MKKANNYLLKQRLSLGLAQNTLADILDVSPQFVGQIEKGRVNPPLYLIGPWCDVIGASKNKMLKLFVEDYRNNIKKNFS